MRYIIERKESDYTIRLYDTMEDYLAERDSLPLRCISYVKETRQVYYQGVY